MSTPTPPETTTSSNGRSDVVLTERQLEIVRHVAEGRTHEQIAKAMFISPSTVRNYLDQIRDRIGGQSVRTVGGLVAYCFRAGWLS